MFWIILNNIMISFKHHKFTYSLYKKNISFNFIIKYRGNALYLLLLLFKLYKLHAVFVINFINILHTV